MVEQKLTIASKISHRLYVMSHGTIVYQGTPAVLKAATDVRQEWAAGLTPPPRMPPTHRRHPARS